MDPEVSDPQVFKTLNSDKRAAFRVEMRYSIAKKFNIEFGPAQ